MCDEFLEVLHGHPLLAGGVHALCAAHFARAFREGMDRRWPVPTDGLESCVWPSCLDPALALFEPYGSDFEGARRSWRAFMGEIPARRLERDAERMLLGLSDGREAHRILEHVRRCVASP